MPPRRNKIVYCALYFVVKIGSTSLRLGNVGGLSLLHLANHFANYAGSSSKIFESSRELTDRVRE